MSASLKVIKSAIAIAMRYPIPLQTNDIPDMVRSSLDVIIKSVANLHYGNTDKLPITPSPLITASTAVTVVTAVTSSQYISVPVSTVQVGNDGKTQATIRSFEIPAHVTISEEIGEQLFLQGYDSNVILPCYSPETYMQILDNYSSIGIGKSCEGDDTVNESPATAKTQFLLIADAYIKKLKLDELFRKFKSRGLTTGGLKKYPKERLEKSMVDKVSVTSYISEEASPLLVFREGIRWKTLAPLEEP